MYTRLAFCGWKWERSARWLLWAMKTMIELFVRVPGMCEAMLDEERCWVIGICWSVFEVSEKVD